MPARTAKVDCDIASDRAKPHLAWPSSEAKDVDVSRVDSCCRSCQRWLASARVITDLRIGHSKCRGRTNNNGVDLQHKQAMIPKEVGAMKSEFYATCCSDDLENTI